MCYRRYAGSRRGWLELPLILQNGMLGTLSPKLVRKGLAGKELKALFAGGWQGRSELTI